MRGVGPVPVMSPMSKSFRKRERAASRNSSGKNSPSSSPAAKKPKICPPEPPAVNVEAKKAAAVKRHSENVPQGHPAVPPATPERSLRPRQVEVGAARRTRRPFCDVCVSESDAERLLGRRIKVWWPLDEKWYVGDIRSYDAEQQRHRVVYDDHDEEWLRLENETFKIQLQVGDGFQKAPPNTKSSYVPNAMQNLQTPPAGVADSSSSPLWESSSTNPTSTQKFYVRRRQPRNGSRSTTATTATSNVTTTTTTTLSEAVEVQSPVRVAEPQEPDLRLEVFNLHALAGPEDEPETAVAAARPVDAVATCALPETSSGVFLEVEQQGDGTGYRIGRWPLTRNVAELLRFIEIRSGGRRGSLVGSRLLKHVWRGTLPVWNIGDLFGFKFGSSTELLASAANLMKPSKLSVGSNQSSVCMLISWNGFTIEKNARLQEVLDASLRQLHSEQKQICWRDSSGSSRSYSASGSYLSVTLLCVPSTGRHLLPDPVQAQASGLFSDRCARLTECQSSVPAIEHVSAALVDGSNCGSLLSGEVQETCSNTKPFCAQTRHSPSAVLPSSHVVSGTTPSCLPMGLILLNSTLRRLFNSLWKDLSGSGLRLSFEQSWALFSSRFLFMLLRTHRMNTEAVLRLERSTSHLRASSTVSTRLGVQELLSMSRKGRRSLKVLKRSGFEDGLPPPKRIRVTLPEDLAPKAEEPSSYESKTRGSFFKARRSPAKKGMWCVTPVSEAADDDGYDGTYSPEEKCAEYDDVGDDESYAYEDDDGEDGLKDQYDIGGKKKRRRGTFGGYDLKNHSAGGLNVPEREIVPCTANLLVDYGDRGWRETGVMVELQRNGNSTSLAVSSPNQYVLYMHTAKRYIRVGIPNRYTHALMWRGGNNWMLEFPDKLQWYAFKTMHDACVRAQYVRELPVPAFQEVSNYSDQDSVPFYRPRDYIHQMFGELEAALLTSTILYDVDSEDEDWLLVMNSRKANLLTADTFESAMHQLERAAYMQRHELSQSAAVELCAALAPAEVIKSIHAHWLERRRRKGMALIRCFQPPPYERYDALVQAWEAESQKHHGLEQPQRFAFCMRPNGSDVPKKMQRQRPQRRAASMSRNWNAPSPEELYLDQYMEESYGHKTTDLSTEIYPGSPGSDAMDESYVSRKRGRKPKRARRMKSISGSDDNTTTTVNVTISNGSFSRKSMRTFIAPATAMNLDSTIDVEQFEGESCSSMDFDLNEDAVLKAQLARKAARIAAAKAARAQELYAHADAAMKRAVACVIEAEALAAAENAARESALMKSQQQQEDGDGDEAEMKQEDEDDDLLLPICTWTQEFGSGLLQRGGDSSVGSPRKSLRYNLPSQSSSSLFKGMVS